jgi:diacylglycerol kinase (ATP)
MTVHRALVVAAALVIAALAAAVVRLAVRTRRGARTSEEPGVDDDASTSGRRVAVVVNPTKFTDLDKVHEQVRAACAKAGWDDPMWIETTADDPGRGQTRQALDAKVDLVCPLGGDGTVREVAEALTGTGTPLGLLPGGTGNLLARNLELPIDSLDAALEVALTGVNRTIDVGLVQFDVSGEDDKPVEKVFLVMAGVGFDAQMMADAPEQLKNRVGWLAYAVSGLRNLQGPRARARIVVDDQPPLRRRVRSILVGNVGQLTGGIVLLPDAVPDDGWLDAVVLSPKGIVSWAAVAARLITRRGHPLVEQLRCKTIELRVDRPTQAQVDGDVIGEVRALRARIEPDALIVRMPQPAAP